MKKFLSFMLVAICLMMAFAPTTYAVQHTKTIEEGFYYIEDVSSGLFLEVAPEGIDNDKQYLRLWDKIYARQSQVFYLDYTTSGWVITCYGSGKIIDVQDSSKNEYGNIVQKKDEGQKSGKWKITKNSDGTFAFRNVNSSMYMNAYYNGFYEMILMQSKKKLSKFNLYRLDESDILDAKWTYNLKKDDIKWTKNNDKNLNIVNNTGWQHTNSKYYPTPGEKYLVGAEYINAADVKQIANMRSNLPKFWKEVKAAVEGKLTKEETQNLLTSLGFLGDPRIDNGMSILEILWQTRNESDWENFIKAANPNKYGEYSGVMFLKSKIVTERGSILYTTKNTPISWAKIIETVTQYSFATWNASGVPNLNEIEGWAYFFK